MKKEWIFTPVQVSGISQRSSGEAGLLFRPKYSNKIEDGDHLQLEVLLKSPELSDCFHHLLIHKYHLLLQVLLSLGASPDYKDRRGLTPLYHTVLTGGDTSCCETMLYHRAKLGIRDENGWDETHQVESGGSTDILLLNQEKYT